MPQWNRYALHLSIIICRRPFGEGQSGFADPLAFAYKPTSRLRTRPFANNPFGISGYIPGYSSRSLAKASGMVFL
jgi:hypothetical protein